MLPAPLDRLDVKRHPLAEEKLEVFTFDALAAIV